MTKKGYTHIILPKPLYEKLKLLASQEGLSMAKLIERLIGINTGINTEEVGYYLKSFNSNPLFKNKENSGLFS
ncbi:MAG: hypothetical protein QXE30_05065, partial [Candidatus Bathyarchaeia archaeon]